MFKSVAILGTECGVLWQVVQGMLWCMRFIYEFMHACMQMCYRKQNVYLIVMYAHILYMCTKNNLHNHTIIVYK